MAGGPRHLTDWLRYCLSQLIDFLQGGIEAARTFDVVLPLNPRALPGSLQFPGLWHRRTRAAARRGRDVSAPSPSRPPHPRRFLPSNARGLLVSPIDPSLVSARVPILRPCPGSRRPPHFRSDYKQRILGRDHYRGRRAHPRPPPCSHSKTQSAQRYPTGPCNENSCHCAD